MKRAIFLIFFVTLFAFSVYQLTLKYFLQANRTPAAIPAAYDFSNAAQSGLEIAAKTQVLRQAAFVQRTGEIGFSLGELVTRDESGVTQSACKSYDKITVEFVAEGIATSGEKPTLTMTGPCRQLSQDSKRVVPLWIPVTRLLKETAADNEFLFGDAQSIHVKFSHMMGEWPEHWVISKIMLSSETDSRKYLNIESREILSILSRPMSMHWDETVTK